MGAPTPRIASVSHAAAATATTRSTTSSGVSESASPSAGPSGSASAVPAKMPAEPSEIPFASAPGTEVAAILVTALRISGWAIAIRIWPASAAAKVSVPSRTAPPTAVSHAPVSSAERNRRSSARPAGIASTT